MGDFEGHHYWTQINDVEASFKNYRMLGNHEFFAFI